MVANASVEERMKRRTRRRKGRTRRSMPVRIGRSTMVDAIMGNVGMMMYLSIGFVFVRRENSGVVIGEREEVTVSIRLNHVLDEVMRANISERLVLDRLSLILRVGGCAGSITFMFLIDGFIGLR